MSLIEGGNSLTEIVNGLAALYDDVETLDDFKNQVDNFARAKNETITKAETMISDSLLNNSYLSSLYQLAPVV
jgi:hypothetical protein